MIGNTLVVLLLLMLVPQRPAANVVHGASKVLTWAAAHDTISNMSVLIDADDLNAMIEGGTPLTILDVRWKLGVGPLPAEHRDGHIPGAVYVDLDTELSTKGEAIDGSRQCHQLRRYGRQRGAGV